MAARKIKTKTNIKGLAIFCAAMCILLGCFFLCIGIFKRLGNITSLPANTDEASSVVSEGEDEEEEEEEDESLDEKHRIYGDLADVTIRLSIGDSVEALDIDSIAPWLNVTKNGHKYSYTIDGHKVREYTRSLAKKYNNFDNYISFVSHYGEELSIPNNSTGWLFDEEYSAEMLEQYISIYQSVELNLTNRTKESNKWWIRVAGDYDANKKKGDCYAEVSISSQYMWVYRNGEVILESPIITGNPNYGNDTPKGAYFIYNMSSPATLYGPGYETEVSYWMAFVDDIGFHDAVWQNYFGGDEYYSNGSHGCVNLPLYFAEELYNTVYIHMPVYVY